MKLLALLATALIAALLMITARELTALIATDAMAVLKVVLFVALAGVAVVGFKANRF